MARTVTVAALQLNLSSHDEQENIAAVSALGWSRRSVATWPTQGTSRTQNV